MFKECKVCSETQTIDNFYANPRMKDGYLNRCKACERDFRRERQRGYNYQKRYGLSIKEVEEMYLSQEGACKICEASLGDDYVVDHCHSGGHVRGLLCQHCNKGLGFFKDSEESLLRAIDYLKTL